MIARCLALTFGTGITSVRSPLHLKIKSNKNGTTYLLASKKGKLLYFGIRNNGQREDFLPKPQMIHISEMGHWPKGASFWESLLGGAIGK